MSFRSHRNLLSIAALVVLALVAGGLSVAALTQERSATPVVTAPDLTESAPSTPTTSPHEAATPSQSPAAQESTPEDRETTSNYPTVVILGDQLSAADAPGAWVEQVAQELGWGSVVNLSAPGRGYIRKPASCDVSPCANFEGTIAAVAETDPDVVVTFGGTADGDQDLSDAAEEYYAALREALPDAELIAISPVTTDDEAEYWLRMHNWTISAGVEAVGGTFIDVGQPGVGDGDQLSTAAQDELAQAIIDELS